MHARIASGVLAFLLGFYLTWTAGMVMAHAQTWQCELPNGSACQPGTVGCACSQVAAPPVQATPVCPIGTFWNGVTCEPAIQVQPPVFVNPHFWHHDHP